MLKSLIKWIIGFAIGGFFIWLSAREWPFDLIFAGDIHFEGRFLISSAWSIDLLYFPLYLFPLTVMHIFRVLRWKPMLRPIKDIDFWTLNKVGAVGFMSVFILPLRIGELVRPYLLSEEKEIPMSKVLGTIALERTIDGLAIGLFLMIVLFFLPSEVYETYREIEIGAYIALAVFISGISFLALLFVKKENVVNIIFRIIKVISVSLANRLSGFLRNFIEGMSVFPDIKNFTLFIFYSLIYWFSNGCGLYIFSRGFGLDFIFLTAFVMESTIVIGMLIPNSPANVGSFWYFLLLPLSLYGVKPGDPVPLVYALCVWLTQLFQLTLFGGYFIVRGKVKITRLSRLLKKISSGEVFVERG